MKYTIAAIPTVYRGRKYRSRLEARWAAFFDLLGWQHEYEPFDLGNWSPDFQLFGERETPVLVEVKPVPVDAIDWDLMVKAHRACRAMRRVDHVLFVGVAPLVYRGSVPIGVMFEVEPPELFGPFRSHAYGTNVVWKRDHWRPRFDPLLVAGEGRCWYSLLTGDAGGDMDSVFPYPEHTMDLWARASNAVQWKGPGA